MLELGHELRRKAASTPPRAPFRTGADLDDFVPTRPALLALMTALGGRAALLTLHADGDPRPLVLAELGDPHAAAESGAAVAAATAAGMPGGREDGPHGARRFPSDGQSGDVLALPFASKSGESFILLAIGFATGAWPDADTLEAALRPTWPLLDAFLRCWQRERRSRRRALATEAALNRLDFGVVLVTRAGQAWFVNDAGDKMLEAGHVVRRRGGVLVATRLAENMMLQSSLASAIAASDLSMPGSAPPDGNTLLKLGSGEHALICAIAPLGTVADDVGDSAAMLILIDPAHNPDQLVQPLCSLYGLSPVETRLACQLVRGASLGEASRALRIKEQTARSYLKQVFVKLNVRRQADLVRMLLTSAVRSRSIVAAEPVLRLAPKQG